MRLRAKNRQLQTRLAVSLVGITLITALCFGLVGELAATQMTDQLLQDRGEAVLDGTQGRIEDRQRAKEVFAQLLANDPDIIAAVAAEDTQAAAAVVVPLRTRLGLSEVTLYTADGTPLLTLSPRQDEPDATLLPSARSGLIDSRATATAAGLMIEAIAPVKNATGVIGAVTVGVTLDDESLGLLAPNETQELAVLVDGEVVAETTDLSVGLDQASVGDGQLHSTEIDGRPFVEVAHEIDGGVLVALIPTTQLNEAHSSRRANLVLGAIIVALAGAFIGVLQARRLSRPIKAMSAVAARIGKGDYDQMVEPSGISDLDQLGGAVNQLSADVQDQMAALSHQALHDPLTGLANRTLFNDRTAHALHRRGREVAVLFVDLDNFKETNDTMGHSVGDALLLEVAGRLNGIIRDGDTVARLGGDEFGLLVEDPKTDPTVVAERLLEALAVPFQMPGREPIAITCSIGIAIGCSGTDSADSVLRDADTAMYVAKNDGKNRYATFEAEMHLQLVERAVLKTDLAAAHDNGELFLHYQPIVSFPDLEQHGAEALLRWNHSTKGPIGPDTFIPLAEESGLIVPLGRWVLRQACMDAASWQRPDQPMGLSVNVSARQFHDETLVGDVADALTASQLPPGLLTIEITETSLMEDVPAASRTIRELKGLGVRVSLDDFGTGYCSLNYLQQFEVDEIKIDKSFVDRLSEHNLDPSLVESVVHMANALGARTVAEGIETADQLAALTAMGCTMGQGYYLARPGGTPPLYSKPQHPITPDTTLVGA